MMKRIRHPNLGPALKGLTLGSLDGSPTLTQEQGQHDFLSLTEGRGVGRFLPGHGDLCSAGAREVPGEAVLPRKGVKDRGDVHSQQAWPPRYGVGRCRASEGPCWFWGPSFPEMALPYQRRKAQSPSCLPAPPAPAREATYQVPRQLARPSAPGGRHPDLWTQGSQRDLQGGGIRY